MRVAILFSFGLLGGAGDARISWGRAFLPGLSDASARLESLAPRKCAHVGGTFLLAHFSSGARQVAVFLLQTTEIRLSSTVPPLISQFGGITMLETVGHILSGIGFVGSLVCFLIVIVKMFQKGSTGMAILCLLLVLCCFGGLIAFILGWVKNKEWDIRTVMLVWTVCIIFGIVGGVLAPGDVSSLQQHFQP
jgi:hypothetical protein